MLHFPPLPTWPNIHPLVIHLPIGALLISPLMMAIGLLPLKTTAFRWASLLLLICGSVGCFVAVKSGEAASEASEVGLIDGADQIVSAHEELAEKTLALFTSITVAYAGLLFAQRYWKRSRQLVPHLAAHGALLAVTGVGLIMIANVGHLGGRLVHQFGVHAKIAEPSPSALGTTTRSSVEANSANHDERLGK